MDPTLQEQDTITLSCIRSLYLERGDGLYGGESVTQLEHALQCAALAERSGASPELITACLFHDLGHLLHPLGEDAAAQGIDDRHEEGAVPYLSARFPLAVTEPIRLHVQAKRYLCAVDPAYWDQLSPASRLSLQLQGGMFDPETAQVFIDRPFAPQAVALRRWDDQAKMVGAETPTLDHFIEITDQVQMPWVELQPRFRNRSQRN